MDRIIIELRLLVTMCILVSYKSEIIHGAVPVRCEGDSQNEVFDMMIVNRLDTFRVFVNSSPHIGIANTPLTIQANIFDSSISSGQCSKYDDRLCLIGVSSLTVGANTFSEAYQIETAMVDGNGSELFVCDMFWVKNVGVVKIIRHDSNSSTFNLLSWNVVQ